MAAPPTGDLLLAALSSGEPELAVRSGSLWVPRLARVVPGGSSTTTPNLTVPGGGAPATRLCDPDGTVLVTGAPGGLGALVARHLAERHGIRHLLLVSRRGPAAPGASELLDQLAGIGATASIVACDVADRDDLARLLAGIPAEHPLTAIIHTAAALDDGVITALRADQIDRVFRPKVDAVLNLDELTRDATLSAFVLFSSVAGRLAGSGSGSYAAANAFVDAFAGRRRAAGRPAVSLAWGLWAEGSSMAGRLNRTGRSGLAAVGLSPMSAAHALALFDTACVADEPLLLPLGLDASVLRALSRSGTLPSVLSGLVRAPIRHPAEDGSGSSGADTGATELTRRLTGADKKSRHAILIALVRAEVAAVLGYPSPQAVDPERAFRALGFDSVSALQLRNRLNAATGLRLPTTFVFDAPTVDAVARYLDTELAPAPGAVANGAATNGAATNGAATNGAASGRPDDEALGRLLATIPVGRIRDAGLLDALLRLSADTVVDDAANGAGAVADPAPVLAHTDDHTETDVDTLDSMDLERLVQLALDETEQ